MNFRTDLAIESTPSTGLLGENDIRQSGYVKDGVTVSRLYVRSHRAADMLKKPIGQYITVQMPSLTDDETDLDRQARTVADELNTLLPSTGTVLVVGLGNRSVTPDTLGPATVDMVLATRHIRGEFARAAGLDDLRPTAVLTPGVLGQTGTESCEIVRGVCREVRPAAVIVVDALAARQVERLGCTVQLCDSGISPGSGVGNNRQPLNDTVLGVPVIGIGIPTVVDAATLICSYLEEPLSDPRPDAQAPMMVTPREVDIMIDRASRLLAMSINRALQPNYSAAQLMAIAGGI